MTQAAFFFDIGGSECVTTLDVEYSVGDTSAATSLRLFMVGAWLPYMSAQCTFREVRVGEAIAVSGASGDGEALSLPANCALIMQKNTGSSVRGRMFLPGLSEADCDPGGRVGSELRGLVDASFDEALDALTADGIIAKVVSTVGAGSAVNITSMRARPLIATLRNRIVTR